MTERRDDEPGGPPVWPPPSASERDPEFTDPSAAPPLDFDPYRFGKPDHPIAPEYAPPGYRPPGPPAAAPPQGTPFAYPPPPPYQPYGVTRQGNGKATVALVLGIIAVCVFWLSIIALVPAVIAIVFGAIALSDARRYPERGGRGMALAGLICGIVAAVAAALFTIVLVHKVGPCLKYDTDSTAYHQCIDDHL